jgi:tetratricopeptide (TPR) repeat protein
MSVIGSSHAPQAPEGLSLVPVPAAVAAFVSVLVYWNALDNPFVYDDFRLIVENTSILNVRDLPSVIVGDITRPLVNLSYAVDTWLWGQRPVGYHVTNVFLHAVNVILVFWVAFLACEDRRRQGHQRMGASAPSSVIAFATAMVFGLHPMMTQAVGYISARSDVAYSMFFLLAFLAGRRWMLGGGKRWWGICISLWVLAMLSKETAAMLSFVLLAYDWFVLDAPWRERRRRFLKLGLPLLGVTFVAGAGRLAILALVEYPEQTGPNWRFALVAVDAFWRYLGILLVPRNQTIFHALPLIDGVFTPRAIAGVGGLIALAALTWLLRRFHSVMAAGIVWFTLLMIPSGLLFMLGRGEPMAEHRAYLSAAGLFLIWGCAFGMLWARVAGRRRIALAIAGSIFLVQLGFSTVVRNAVWQDPVALAREAADLAPEHWMPRILVAEALRQNRRCTEAVTEYRTAIALRPQYEFPYTRLSACLIEGRRFREAEDALRQLQAVNPASQDAGMGIGLFAIMDGRIDEARKEFEQVLEREPGRARARQMLEFLDGVLPQAEHERLCQELRSAAGGTLKLDVCHEPSSTAPPDSSIR